MKLLTSSCTLHLPRGQEARYWLMMFFCFCNKLIKENRILFFREKYFWKVQKQGFWLVLVILSFVIFEKFSRWSWCHSIWAYCDVLGYFWSKIMLCAVWIRFDKHFMTFWRHLKNTQFWISVPNPCWGQSFGS